MTADQLETAAYEAAQTKAICSECGTIIDTEQDYHGISINGESYVCEMCIKDFAKLTVIKKFSEPGTFFASASHNREELTTDYYTDEKAALKRAEYLAELCFGVKSFIECN